MRTGAFDLSGSPVLHLQHEQPVIHAEEDKIGPLALNVRFVPTGEGFIGPGDFLEKAEYLLFALGGFGKDFDVSRMHLGHRTTSSPPMAANDSLRFQPWRDI